MKTFTLTSSQKQPGAQAGAGTGGEGSYANGLVLSGNTLYGTAVYGGTATNGTVFAINTDGSDFTTLHDFTALPAGTSLNNDGVHPTGGLVFSGGTLYGTTQAGGAGGAGTVFSISLPVTLPQLTISPAAGNVVLSWPTNATGFTLQSTTNLASPAVWTTVSAAIAIVNGQNTVTNPISGTQQFYLVNESYPPARWTRFGAALVQTDSTEQNRLRSVVRRLRPALGLFALCAVLPAARAAVTLTTLYSFSGPEGANPVGGLVRGSDGNFYGMTQYGGLGYTGANSSGTGTVFCITHEGVLSNLYQFSGASDGGWPETGLIQGADGNFYGTTGGGTLNWGALFQITPTGQLTKLLSVGGSLGFIESVLLPARDGNLYAVGDWPGWSGQGTLFSLTPGGVPNVLISFTGTNGFTGWASDTLIQGTDGNFYGTTQFGGPEFTGAFNDPGQGTAFVMTPDGTLTTLVSFYGTNGSVPTALVQGTDGNLYGTTYHGGEGFVSNSVEEFAGYGTVFKLSTSGILTTLALFNSTSGGHAQSLIQASNGNFYGTTYDGGTNGGYGGIFSVTTNGILTSLLWFSRTNGANPYYAPLLQDTDGSFYGTTFNGGAYNRGTIFRLTLTPTPPLTIIAAGASIVLCWPANGTNFTLQSTTSLSAPASWEAVSPAPLIVNGMNTVTDLLSGTQRFYRLVQQLAD